MAFRYESESGTKVDSPSESDLDLLLSRLNGEGDSFASLTSHDGSYVQVGGGPTEFTVEFRKFESDGSFRHFKAALPGLGPERRLRIGGASVAVRECEVIGSAEVRAIFRAFLHDGKADSTVEWRDMTAMFQ